MSSGHKIKNAEIKFFAIPFIGLTTAFIVMALAMIWGK